MKDYNRILLSTLVSNFAGAASILFYFAYIDLETFRANRLFWRGTQPDWSTFFATMIALGALVWIASDRYTRPLREWEAKGRGAAAKTPDAPLSIQRRAANYPLTMALISLSLWLVTGVFFAQGGLQFFSAAQDIFWRTFLGTALIGGLTNSTFVFLAVDFIWADHLPIFFPCGHIRRVRAPRVSVGRRLAAIFLITGVVPLVALGVAARNGALGIMESTVNPYEILDRLQLTVLFIVVLGIVSNLTFAALAVHSLLHPLKQLTAAMDKVGRGDMAARVPVESNDELGDLADNFNDMLDDLNQAQSMRDLFGRYVSQEVAAQVLKDGAHLGGTTVQATALFADIRDFTGLSERLPAQDVVNILNRYYTRMVDVVVAEGGIVNKFGGDSLLAIFGAPIRQPDHALRAVRAAWQMQRAVAAFNAEQLAMSLPPLTIGIGISSGDVIAGNVGGEARLEYTVIGDPVNLASRLQSLTKEWGTPVLLSENTQSLVGEGQADVQPRQRIAVRGKKQPTLIYELCGVA